MEWRDRLERTGQCGEGGEEKGVEGKFKTDCCPGKNPGYATDEIDLTSFGSALIAFPH
jgi:ribosome modulation factor